MVRFVRTSGLRQSTVSIDDLLRQSTERIRGGTDVEYAEVRLLNRLDDGVVGFLDAWIAGVDFR